METNRSIDADEAVAALASVRRSRARVAWSGYPAWYWPATGAALGVATGAILMPGLWFLAIPAAGMIALAARAANRARGVCEGWVPSATTWQEGLVLGGPTAAVILAGAFGRFLPRRHPGRP